MKTTRLLVALFLTSLSTVAVRAEKLPAASQGEVTLDWQKFQDLWTKMQDMEKKIEQLEKPENAPPVPFTITKAAYKGMVGEKKTDMTAIFELDVYEPKDWVKVPFFPSGVAITEAALDGQPVGLVQENGFHQVVLRKAGRHVLRVRFALNSPKAEEVPQLSFSLPNTPITLFALEFDRPHLDVKIEPSQGVETNATGKQHTLVTAALPSTNYAIVRWQKALAEETEGPAKIYVDAQSLISVSEGTLKARWNLSYSILRRGVRELRVRVPQDWNILAVTCDGLQEWKLLDSAQGPVLRLQLAYARKGNLDVGIQMERAVSDQDIVVEAPRVQALDIEREQGTIAVEAKGAIELAIQDAPGLQPMDPRELPGGIWQTSTQPLLFAFRYTKSHGLTLSVKRHPETPVLTTTVDSANAISVLTDRGQWITKIRYQVRNQLKQNLTVSLPPGSQLWSAFVAGEAVKPMKAEDGTYRIPLAKSQLGEQGQGGFPVELIYYRPTPKLSPMGLRRTTLPMPDAPVSHMLWSVYLPEKYRFPYFGGDVEKGETGVLEAFMPSSSVSRSDLSDIRDQNKDKAGLKKEFKQKIHSLRSMAAGKSVDAVNEMVERQEEVASGLFQANAPIPTQVGVLPVAFELPASGHLYHFGQVMVVGQSPELSFGYFHQGFLRVAGFLLLALLLRALYPMRGRLVAWIKISAERMKKMHPALEI